MSKIVTREQAAAELLLRQSAEDSLYEFTKQAWPISEGARNFVPNWHLEAMAEHLEAMATGEIRSLLINIPPRTFKSGLCSVMLCPWVWLRQPHLQFLYISYAQDLSVRDSRKGRQIIESSWFQTRWQDRCQIISDSNRLIRFDNNKGGYRLSSSIDSKVTGEGADWWILDDPNNVRDRSETMLQSALDFFREVLPTRLNDFKTGRRLCIMQRMHEKDISGEILSKDEGDWTKLILPMEFEEKRRAVTVVLPSTKGKRWQDPRKEEGDLLFPARIGPVELKRLKRELGSEFAVSGQLQQRPAPEAGGIIKRHWFKIWQAEKPPPCTMTLTAIDTAVTANKLSAHNVATTWGVFMRAQDSTDYLPNPTVQMPVMVPNVILLSMWRKQAEYHQTRAMVQRLAVDYMDDDLDKPRNSRSPKKPDIMLIEAKSTGITLIQDMRRAGVSVWPYNPDKRGDKLQRVHLVTPIMAAGRVWLPGDPAKDFKEPREWVAPFMHEMLSFPNGSTRDIVDTVSMALDHLNSFNFIWHPSDPQEEEKPTEWPAEGESSFY